ncbi:MAG: DNA ligase [Desulfobulbaceae bacterium BRH_c16a]|nr:MAG: DNA ligase [Desulfobulbaceae bacterium BRH_c16a]
MYRRKNKKAMAKSLGLSPAQHEILAEAEFNLTALSEQELLAIAEGDIDLDRVDDDQLIELLNVANLLYRGGELLISDELYDFTYLAELKRRIPDHPFLHTVEPEPYPGAKTVELPVRMLSTEKAYNFNAIERWAKRIEKAAGECGVDFAGLIFRATPKLDGFAAYDDGKTLYTRGDGRRGTDITRVFERGLQVAKAGARGLGAGEVVVSRSYFQAHLAPFFDNSRNFQASLIKEKELEPHAVEAIKSGHAVFFPFALLPCWEGEWSLLAADFDGVVDRLWQAMDFDVDGIVLDIDDERIRQYMGATRHHHRWQIAFKKNTETAEVKVLRVIAQTSRSGRVNPVAEVEPTRLSGALIQRATAHHYNMVREKGIGPGAVIRLSRSGEVIPKIEEVLVPVVPELPEECPSCGSPLVWENDYLLCIDTLKCPAQITNGIEHFFKVLGNVDGFGQSSIRKIFAGGIRSLPEIYALAEEQLVDLGFGPKQAENMVAQLQRSRMEPIEDWRFLAAFGNYRMGMGNCEKLLSVFPLERVFLLTKEEIVAIRGFSDKTADEMLAGLRATADLFTAVYGLGFNLIATPLETDQAISGNGPLAGKLIVFTGTMRQGSREDMKKQAKALGAKVGDAITGKTDLLVCGEKVGAAKLNKARGLGVRIVSEEDYVQQLLESGAGQ